MEKLEYIQIPTTGSELKYIVFYQEQEFHVVLEEGVNKTLKEVLEEGLGLGKIELKQRGSRESSAR